MPKPAASVFAAYREIIPAILRQAREPLWHLEPQLPPGVTTVTESMEQ